MEKQIIVSVGREYGSGGHLIASLLAEKLNIPLYDRNLLDEVANTKHVDSNDLSKYDEKPRKFFFSRTVRGYSNSPEQNVAEMQFALIKSKAADGDSFVIVGRCADELFRGDEELISVFIYADKSFRLKRIQEVRGMNEKHAMWAIERHDRKRRAYHNYFSKGGKWGETSNYDLCVNSAKLGIEGTADFLCEYVKARIAQRS